MVDVAVTITGQDKTSKVFAQVADAGETASKQIEKAAASADAAMVKADESIAKAAEEMDGAAAAATRAGSAIQQAGEKAQVAGDKSEAGATKFKVNWEKVAVTLGVAGVALEALGRKAAGANKVIETLAIKTGLSGDAIRQTAQDVAGAGDDIGETLTLMEVAAQRGAKTEAQLASFAGFWDTVADAVGGNAIALANYSPALQAVGIGLGQESEALAALGFMQTKTTTGTEGFLSSLERLAPEIKQLGLDVNQSAAVFGILESRGITGRAAMEEFNKAVSDSDGNQKKFFEALGITNATLGEYVSQVQAAGPIIEALAAQDEAHQTIIQKLTNAMSEQIVKHGEFFEKASQLSPVLIGLSTALGAIVAVAPAVSAAITAMGVALNVSTGGVLLIIGAVVAAIALLATAWTQNWGDIQGKTSETFENIKAVVIPALEAIWAYLQPWIADLVAGFQVLATDLGAAWQKVWAYIQPVINAIVGFIRENWDTISGVITAVMDTIMTAIKLAVQGWYQIFSVVLSLIWGAVKTAFGLVVSTVQWGIDLAKKILSGDWSAAGRQLIQTFVDGIKALAMAPYNAVKWILNKVRALLPGSDADEGPLSDITASGKGMMATFAKGVTAGSPQVVKAVEDSWARVDAAVERLSSQTGKKMSEKEIEEEKKKDAELMAQREFDNKTALAQMEEQAAAEIANAEKNGQDSAAKREYWAKKIADEQTRITQEQADKEEEIQRKKEESWKRAAEKGKEIIAEQEEAERQYWQNRADLASASADLMNSLYELSGEKSRTFFEIAKAAAISEAIINSWLAYTTALKSYPPPLGDIMGGIALAQGLAAVAKIAAQKPALAKGGIVTRPMEALIGEAGPEAVIPLNKMKLGSGAVYNLNFNQSGVWTMDPAQARDFFRSNVRYMKGALAR